jgi:iron complex transport system ATP-binding protein
MTFLIDNLSLGYQGKPVLHGLSLPLNRGQVIGVLGSNGAGKSTFLTALAGDLKPWAGQVLLNGEALKSLSVSSLAQKRAVLSQNPEFAFNMTTRQLLELGLYAFESLDEVTVHALYERAIRQMHIDHALLDAQLLQLSGGQRQRVHMARVLMQLHGMLQVYGQGWLLLDEPLTSLDPLHQQQLLALCQKLVREANVGVVMVLHDLNLAAQWCDRLILLADQQVLIDAKPREVLTSQNLYQAFGMPFEVFERVVGGSDRLIIVAN